MISNYYNYRNTRFFSSLDGLRCISIIAVIWHHTASKSYTISIAHQGAQGVTLFFCISGFLITTLLLRELDTKGNIDLNKFYIRRSLRIFPLYYTVILIYCFLTYIIEGNTKYGIDFFNNLKYFISYTSNWFVDLTNDRVIFFFAWSLATEEQFYLVWPSIEKFFTGWRSALCALFFIFLSQIFKLGFISTTFTYSFFPNVIISSISVSICMGVILAHLLHNKHTFNIVNKVLGRDLSSAIAFILSIIILSYIDYFLLLGDLIIAITFTLLVGSCVIREDNSLSKLLTFKPITYIGTISYGVYLLHMLAANAAKKLFFTLTQTSPLMYFALTLLIVVLSSSISYHYYESFFIKFKSKFEIK